MNSMLLSPAVSCSLQECEFALEAGQLWSAILPVGALVRCVRGTLWLTQSGDATDWVLLAGQIFTATHSSHVVAQAMDGQSAIFVVTNKGE